MDELKTIAGRAVLVCTAEGPPVASEADAVEIIGGLWGLDAEWLVLPTSRLSADFFKLGNGMAGAVIQKFVTYRLRLAVVGAPTDALARSGALRDFVRESNAGDRVWFVADLAELEARLAARSAH